MIHLHLLPCENMPAAPTSPLGAGAAVEGQHGSSGRGAGAERTGRGSGERECPLLPAACAGHETGDGGAEPGRAGEQPQTHGAGNHTL